MAEEDKAKLKELLNKAHTLRLSSRGASGPSLNDATALQAIAQECLQKSESLNMEHGKALSLELLAFGKMMELDAHYQTEIPQTDTEKNEVRIKYAELEPGLVEAQKIAVSYNDAHLLTRILELLANIYRRADAYDKEVQTIEFAVKISRTTPKVVALLDAYHRMINFLSETQPDNADVILKAHTHYWENYLWLKEQPGFDRDKFIQSKRMMLYKIAVYLGSIAGNPLNLGEQNPEDFKISMEAFDEAIHISTVLQNYELLCAAHAHKAVTLVPKLGFEEKRQLLANLISLNDKYHPTNNELPEMIEVLKQDLSKSAGN